MTGNSRFNPDEIEVFATLIKDHGGRLIQHIFLARGRINWQKSRTHLLEEIDTRTESMAK
ncbi:hypothetical protein D3C76_1607440 [compost metagenome]